MELFPLLQHGLDEDVQLVGALVLGPVDPPVVPLAVLQAGQDRLLGLVYGGHVWWRLERTSLQAEAVLTNAVASLFLGVGLVFLCGFLSTTTLWVSLLVISVAVISEVPLNSAATHKVFSWAFLPPITVLFIWRSHGPRPV